MTARLSLIEYIRILARTLFRGHGKTLKQPRSYEVEILPAAAHRKRQLNQPSIQHASKAQPLDLPPMASGNSVRFRPVKPESGAHVEDTRSNLG